MDEEKVGEPLRGATRLAPCQQAQFRDGGPDDYDAIQNGRDIGRNFKRRAGAPPDHSGRGDHWRGGYASPAVARFCASLSTVRSAQAALARHLEPGGLSAKQTLDDLYAILDDQELISATAAAGQLKLARPYEETEGALDRSRATLCSACHVSRISCRPEQSLLPAWKAPMP